MMITVGTECLSCGDVDSVDVRFDDLVARKQGALVQDAFPYLTLAQREFHFQSHICPTCWDRMFGEDA